MYGAKNWPRSIPICALVSIQVVDRYQQHTNSLVLYSFRSLIASNSQTNALVLLVPLFPGFICTSLLNCRQLARSAYRVAREKCAVKICCCIGLTKNCDTCGDRSWSQERVVSHRGTMTKRIVWVKLYTGNASTANQYVEVCVERIDART